MFQLNGKPLAIDTPFMHDDVQYPANWLRLASEAEKAAIGITEVSDPVLHDDRFYWAPGVPKDLDMLKAQIVSQVKTTAGSLLAPTDWKVIRAAEGIKNCDETTLKERSAIREASDVNEKTILSFQTVDELAQFQPTWPVKEM